jgi:hypothetical protein
MSASTILSGLQINTVDHQVVEKRIDTGQILFFNREADVHFELIVDGNIEDTKTKSVDPGLFKGWSETLSVDLGPLPAGTSEYEVHIYITEPGGSTIIDERTSTGTV